MAEPKFTPGPWKYGQSDYDEDTFEQIVKSLPINHKACDYGDGASIFGADGEEVAGNTEYQVFYKPEDVALILAAPDMYEALKAECNRCINRKITLGNPCEYCITGKALRKARGEE